MGIRDEIASQKERLFLWAPVAFGGGIALYFAIGSEPAWWAGLAAFACLLPFAVMAYRRQHDDVWRFGLYLAVEGLLLMTLGFAAAQSGTMRHGTPILEKPMKFADVTGTVESVEKLAGRRGSRALLGDVVIEDLPPEKTPKRVRLTFRKDEGLAAGQRIETLARLDAPSGPVAPGSYDFRRHLFFGGIGVVGFAYRPGVVIEAAERGGLALWFEKLRHRIDARIHEGGGSVTGGIMSALITGHRGAIAEADDDAMRDSGLYHLLSISGTHVAMVAGVLFFVSRFLMACWPWLALHWPIKKIAAALALGGAAFYVTLAGAEVPAQRALLMTGIVMIAIMLDRSPLSLRLIAFSALVVLAVRPSALVGVSFQMSFAAVAALICFFDYIRTPWMAWYARSGWVRKGLMYLIAVMLTSLIAGTVTGLFSLYHFQSFALYGVLSNMIAVPLTGAVIMPAAVAAMVLMQFGLEASALTVMDWGCAWMLAIAHWAAGFDGATIHVRQWPGVSYACLSIGTILFLLWRGWRGKAGALILIAAGLTAALFTPAPDIFVSATGKLAAVRTKSGLYVSDRRREKFAAENWQRLSGFDDNVKPMSFKDDDAPMLCDDAGCRWEKNGRKVSFIFKDGAVHEDCGWADLLIAQVPVGKAECNKADLYDLYDLRDAQGASFTLDDGIKIRTVRSAQSSRPWRSR